jgi:CIC family chloride channel protein
MSGRRPGTRIRRLAVRGRAGLRRVWDTLVARGPSQAQFWLIALGVGIAAGFAALGFRLGIDAIQRLIYGTDDVTLASHARELPWLLVLAVPICGGLAVGLILHWFTPDGQVRAVADVIDGAARQRGRVETRAGLASAAASLLTLSTGGSSGREGPVVHLAGVIATWVSDRISADGITGRELLGCAVAAAVSASFNAPIAGTLFALEVVLRHFAVRAFAPIAIAAVAGTVVNRLRYGDITEFRLATGNTLDFYVELPAFLILGLVCGLVGVVLMRAIFLADDIGNAVQRRTRLPRWARPMLSGAVLGAVAVWFPHIIGVGYETTSRALSGDIGLWNAIVFAAVKVFAVAVTFGGRMGGGVFSPALMLGALTGLAFGIVATGVFPQVSGGPTLYALAGMGAVAAAVLGAPISTTLIVFELTGDWQTGLAVMVAVSLSTALASRLVARSFFLTQLERRNVRLAAGPQAYLLGTFRVARLMRAAGSPRAAPEAACRAMIERGVFVDIDATLEAAMPLFERGNPDFLPVIQPAPAGGKPVLVGALFQVDALWVFSRALAARAAEEHS